MSYQGSVSPASSLERLLERLIRTVVGWARAADGCRATCMADHMATQTTTSSFWKAACIAKYARTATSCSRLGWASTGRASFPKGHFASCSSSCSRRRSSRQVPRVARPGLCVMIGAIASRATSLRALRADPTGAVVGKMPANGVWGWREFYNFYVPTTQPHPLEKVHTWQKREAMIWFRNLVGCLQPTRCQKNGWPPIFVCLTMAYVSNFGLGALWLVGAELLAASRTWTDAAHRPQKVTASLSGDAGNFVDPHFPARPGRQYIRGLSARLRCLSDGWPNRWWHLRHDLRERIRPDKPVPFRGPVLVG